MPDPAGPKPHYRGGKKVTGHAVADAFLAAGQGAIAEKIWGFIGGMHRPLTTDEQLVSKLEERTRTRERERQEGRTRCADAATQRYSDRRMFRRSYP